MSVKAISLVWDFPCPSMVNELEFKPGHKYVLIAYADHADHHGRNIYPAVSTVARKTGYDERSVQRLTHELNGMGILVPDGEGPRGTNRFYIPFNKGGDKISPLTKLQGDNGDESLGDIPSGDIPSGDKMAPELKELNLVNLYINKQVTEVWASTLETLKAEMPKASFETWMNTATVAGMADHTLVIKARNAFSRDWISSRMTSRLRDITGYEIFVIASEEPVHASE